MIRFQWKGVESTATLTPDGWIGPPDLDLGGFKTEADAAARLGGAVESPVPPPAAKPVTPVIPAPVPAATTPDAK